MIVRSTPSPDVFEHWAFLSGLRRGLPLARLTFSRATQPTTLLWRRAWFIKLPSLIYGLHCCFWPLATVLYLENCLILSNQLPRMLFIQKMDWGPETTALVLSV